MQQEGMDLMSSQLPVLKTDKISGTRCIRKSLNWREVEEGQKILFAKFWMKFESNRLVIGLSRLEKENESLEKLMYLEEGHI